MKRSKIVIIIFSFLVIFGVGCVGVEISNKSRSLDSDSIMYNSYYEYTSDKINFLLKERGYDFTEDYNNENIRFLKKQMLIMLKTEELDNDELFCEIYNGDNLGIRSPIYKSGEYYYTDLQLSNMAKLEDNITIKILDSEDNLLYDFSSSVKEE